MTKLPANIARPPTAAPSPIPTLAPALRPDGQVWLCEQFADEGCGFVAGFIKGVGTRDERELDDASAADSEEVLDCEEVEVLEVG